MTPDRRSRTLSPDQARSVYNRIGRAQDWQSFYEAAPIDEMVEHGEFGSATSVYEFGCGTGALAERLLTTELDDAARYFGVDISEKMTSIAAHRLAPWPDRSEVRTVAGGFPLPGDDGCSDRFVATFVFDLLSVEYAEQVLDEARRLLVPGGLICLVSLTEGTTPPGRIVAGTWRWIWSKAPTILGGCRPVEVATRLTDRWTIVHRRVSTSWAVPSEVIVARSVE